MPHCQHARRLHVANSGSGVRSGKALPRIPLAALVVAIIAVVTGTPTPTLVAHPIVSSAAPVYLDGTDWTVYRFGNGTGPAGPSIPASVP